MATLEETIWVHNHDELHSTVQRLVSQGGVVQNQTEDEVQLFLKKKMNILVLVVGLILCLVPGLAYLIWFSTADQSQAITVKVGAAPTLGGYHPEEDEAAAASNPSTAMPTGGPGVAPPLPSPSAPPAAPIPPPPAADPVPAPPPAADPMPAPPPPPTGDVPPAPPQSF